MTCLTYRSTIGVLPQSPQTAALDVVLPTPRVHLRKEGCILSNGSAAMPVSGDCFVLSVVLAKALFPELLLIQTSTRTTQLAE